MAKVFRVFVIFVFFYYGLCQTGRGSLENYLVPFRTARQILMNFAVALQERNKSPIRNTKLQRRLPKSHSFFCDLENTRSSTKPTSVHELRPGDIDVVAALGDSLTAGFGVMAINHFELIVEERGKSFSIGGEGDWRSVTTLPNILKVFNPNLVGFSTKSSLSIELESQLNVAEVAAISADLPYMAWQLINRIKSENRIKIVDDWKMVTIFIGANDFCGHICYLDDPFSSLVNHRRDLTQTLRILRDNLPRTFVNVIPAPNIRTLVEMKFPDSFCYITQLVECPCFFGLQFAEKRKILYEVMLRWQEIDLEVSSSSEFDRDDFTVVAQPFTLNYTFPVFPGNVANLRYLAPDCFHFSQKMQARIANDLWNAVMEPVGNKSLDGQELFRIFKCPNKDHPYVLTRRNSFP